MLANCNSSGTRIKPLCISRGFSYIFSCLFQDTYVSFWISFRWPLPSTLRNLDFLDQWLLIAQQFFSTCSLKHCDEFYTNIRLSYNSQDITCVEWEVMGHHTIGMPWCKSGWNCDWHAVREEMESPQCLASLFRNWLYIPRVCVPWAFWAVFAVSLLVLVRPSPQRRQEPRLWLPCQQECKVMENLARFFSFSVCLSVWTTQNLAFGF